MLTNIFYATFHPSIAHLSIAQIEELHSRFINGEKLAPLLIEYKISTNSKQLNPLLPLRTLLNTSCPNCSAPLQLKWATKTTGQSAPFCKPCEHTMERGCQCAYCWQLTINRLNGKWGSQSLQYSELDFQDKLLTLTLLSHPNNKNTKRKRFRSHVECSAKTKHLNKLRIKGIIKLADMPKWSSSLNDLIAYYPEEAVWRTNAALVPTPVCQLADAELIETIQCDIHSNLTIANELEIISLIHELLEDDLYSYLQEQLSREGLNITTERYTRAALKTLINKLPPREIFAAIWEAAKSASSAFKNGKATCKKHAGNMIPNALLRRGEHRISNTECWKHDYYPVSESLVAPVLRVLGLTDHAVFFSLPLERYHANYLIARLTESFEDNQCAGEIRISSFWPVRVETVVAGPSI
ncbi:hypothetical protein [Pseudomonas huaxiensis]|uniref:hypothetical protein n=1 Tax=Pseudomonas huaxiensis TaxID=2213017 RepID=UPI00130043F6|nr:hypothetical protein [Pseudomonas huaxiensis]